MDEKETGISSTEEKIFEAARDVFHQKGFDGARMQEIANRANINKSMLHYYYRSKDKLFEKVYQISMMKAIPQIVSLLNEDHPLEKKIPRFVDGYLRVIRANPEIPSFILRELNSNPSRLKNFFRAQIAKKLRPFINQLEHAYKNGEIYSTLKPEQVIINMMSLIIFPFIAKHILDAIFEMDDETFEQFIDERQGYLPGLVLGITLDHIKQ